MLSKTLSTATLFIVAWMAVQLLQTQQALGGINVQVNKVIEKVQHENTVANEAAEKRNGVVLDSINTLKDEQIKLAKSAQQGDPKKLKSMQTEINRLAQTIALQKIYQNVLEAESLANSKKGSEAAELLLSTKKSIWNMSDKVKDSKEVLRGLMAPVDILSNKWKRDDFTGNTAKIKSVLSKVLAAQAQS